MAAKLMPKINSNTPVIVILGCTGTGKSKLAIELAKKFNGEVINADAMQMYKGLDIITNKVTPQEQEGILHHVLGQFNPLKMLTVCKYRDRALLAMNEIISRNKLPIIVGGTYYYVESLLYDFVLTPPTYYDCIRSEGSTDEGQCVPPEELTPQKKMKMTEYDYLPEDLEKLDNEELFEKLKVVDPELAKQVHPNYRRKIIRSLMIPLQFGETLSSLLHKQRSQPGGCSSGGPLKLQKSFILSLECDRDVLNTRLDARVDDMISRGLVEELIDFHIKYNEQNAINNKSPDYTKGIFQSIGFKEFHEFLILSPELRESEEGKKLFEKGVEMLKLRTKRYAKTQIKWIRNRFVKNGKRQSPPIYSLNATDVSKWKENVYDVAEHIVECHLSDRKPSVEPVAISSGKIDIDRTYQCECGSILVGKDQWELHIKGKRHQRKMKELKKLELEKEKLEKEKLSEENRKEKEAEEKVKKIKSSADEVREIANS